MYCVWRSEDKLMQQYHDNVYGVLKKDTNTLFKWLILEQAQAGLSWQTVINKEAYYDEFFENFDVLKVSKYNVDDTLNKLVESKIIKNKLKTKAVIHNAQLIVEIEKEEKFFDYLITMIDEEKSLDDNVDEIVKKMKKKGFKFIGYEIVKSFYESVGLINNHQKECQCYIKPLFEFAN